MTIEEIDKKLRFLKIKYFFKNILKKTNNNIVQFIALNTISNKNIFYKKTLRESQLTNAFLPKLIGEESTSIQLYLPPVELYGLQDVGFSTDTTAFLDRTFNFFYYEKVRDFSSQYTILLNTNTLHFHSHHLAKISNLTKVKRNEDVFFLAGNFTFNYFHFLIEILPKLKYFSSIPNSDQVIIVADYSIKSNINLQTILCFFTKQIKIEYLSRDNFYFFNKTWHITYPNYVIPNIVEGEEFQANFAAFSKESVEYVRTICLENFDSQQIKVKAESRIFLARKSAIRRYNEKVILSIAQKYGFKEVCFEDCNIHEQIFYMRNADYIIGPSGASWTNLIFCHENKTKGLMWLGKVWNDFSVFSTLAKFVNFDLCHYRYDQESPSFHANYELSVSEFEEQLKKLLLK